MKASQFLISTLKEAPADAEVVSHKLMTRAGMIKKLGAGIYNYMPMGLRVIRKVEAIIREEMNRAGAVELLMPVVQPAELWQESGRFQAYGPELLRVKDRHERDFIIQPTSEEVITDIARQELRTLVNDLTDTMLDAPGAGLAAPQLGVSLRVFVWDVDDELGHLINPVLDLTDFKRDLSELTDRLGHAQDCL